jgi:hypothetical protein
MRVTVRAICVVELSLSPVSALAAFGLQHENHDRASTVTMARMSFHAQMIIAAVLQFGTKAMLRRGFCKRVALYLQRKRAH